MCVAWWPGGIFTKSYWAPNHINFGVMYFDLDNMNPFEQGCFVFIMTPTKALLLITQV